MTKKEWEDWLDTVGQSKPWNMHEIHMWMYHTDIVTISQLLSVASTREQREKLFDDSYWYNMKDTAMLGPSKASFKKILLTLVNYADLCRVPGVTPDRARDLHDLAGIDSPAELARRNPKNTIYAVWGKGLLGKFVAKFRLNTYKKIIEEAAKLDKIVKH